MRFKVLVALVAVVSTYSSDPVERFDQLQIGTNTFRNVTLTKRNELEATMSHDGGLRRIKLEDLPEPLRSKWYDTTAAAEFEKAREQERKQKEQETAANREEAKKRGVTLEKYYDQKIAEVEAEVHALQKRTRDIHALYGVPGKRPPTPVEVDYYKKSNLLIALQKQRLALNVATGKPSSANPRQRPR
jgi:hypothetical protein